MTVQDFCVHTHVQKMLPMFVIFSSSPLCRVFFMVTCRLSPPQLQQLLLVLPVFNVSPARQQVFSGDLPASPARVFIIEMKKKNDECTRPLLANQLPPPPPPPPPLLTLLLFQDQVSRCFSFSRIGSFVFSPVMFILCI